MSVPDPATAYDRHVGRYGAQLAAGLIAVAAVHRGQRALDVGCGSGALTIALARVLGAENVAAVDPFEPYVETCRLRVPGADVRLGIGEQLPFGAGSVDVVLAQLVVQLMEDSEAGVHEMARVARPGGTVAACVWDSGGMPLLRSFWDAALEAAPERVGEIADGRRVGYQRPEELGALFEHCGLADVATGELLAGADYESFDELWRPFTAGVGHSGSCCASLDPGRQADLRRDVYRRLGSPEGAFGLSARAWWARGSVR
jgi:ubiquinone/menaquinone biosynthesis C-methylase UbiE